MSVLQDRRPESWGAKGLAEAVRCLRSGGVVAFPTDTLYGLGADVGNESALQRIFDIKGRPEGQALPVLVADWEQVGAVTRDLKGRSHEAGLRLARAFWPGPLTLALLKSPTLSRLVTGNWDTVAVRMPNHWAPLMLAGELGRPITGTSANRSGEPDLTSIADIEANLGGMVDFLVKEGPPPRGTPSTVVSLVGDVPALIREGAIPFAEVLRVWNEA